MLRFIQLMCTCFLCLSSFAQIPPRDADFTGRLNDVVTLPNGDYIAVGFQAWSYLQQYSNHTLIWTNIPGLSKIDSVPIHINQAVAVQSDGKVLLTGVVGTVRLNQNGTIDSSFVNIALGGVDIAVNCEGKIFLADAGYIIQLDSNGSLNTAFGNGGSVDLGFLINHILLQPDGKIIASGSRAVARYNADGTVDAGFHAALPSNLRNFGKPALQADGKLVVPGVVTTSPYTNSVAVSRLNPNGSLDSTFGVNGTAISNANAWTIVGAVVQEDGKIVAGFSTASGGFYTLYYYGLVRFTKEGGQDPTLTNQYPGFYLSSYALKPNAIAMGWNKVYVAGETIYYPLDKSQPINEYPALAAYYTDGQPMALKPGIVAPADIVVSNDPGVCSASHVQLGSAVSTRACTQSITNNAPAVFPGGTTRVTWTVTGINGVSNTATQLVTVKDTEKPVVQVPATQMFCSGAGNYTIPRPGYHDNCELRSIVYSITGATQRAATGEDASGYFNVGTSTIAWTVGDSSGNLATATTQVIVSQPFTVSVPDVYALKTGTSANTVYTGYAPASSVSLTAMASVSGVYTYRWSTGATTQSITVSPAATTTYTVTVTNQSGCSIQASKTISVVDVRCGNKNDKVIVCKVAPGNGKTESLCVASNAVEAQLKNGSYLGSCNGQSNSSVMRNGETSISGNDFSVTVSDNPTITGFGLIVNSQSNERVSMKIYGGDGRLIETKTVRANVRVEFGSGYQAGVYFAELTQGSEKRTVKLVKVR